MHKADLSDNWEFYDAYFPLYSGGLGGGLGGGIGGDAGVNVSAPDASLSAEAPDVNLGGDGGAGLNLGGNTMSFMNVLALEC